MTKENWDYSHFKKTLWLAILFSAIIIVVTAVSPSSLKWLASNIQTVAELVILTVLGIFLASLVYAAHIFKRLHWIAGTILVVGSWVIWFSDALGWLPSYLMAKDWNIIEIVLAIYAIKLYLTLLILSLGYAFQPKSYRLFSRPWTYLFILTLPVIAIAKLAIWLVRKIKRLTISLRDEVSEIKIYPRYLKKTH